ncbi:hypothetical protein PR048_006392 [Dryococelus australis]|uniref:Integrase zinc-binding domain-containing protein n=1 Tax=Dryococelus australis TaxID=614101 RepID=A0ABQ9IAX7_9NEOP|nr:hypothetical protein PR048_006392 [Dryococelus australis]
MTDIRMTLNKDKCKFAFSEMHSADYPYLTVKEPSNPADCFFIKAEDAPYEATDIALATERDDELCKVKTWLENGRWWFLRELQSAILEESHHHPGVVAMKKLARCYFWWRGLDADIQLVIGSCQLCQETRHGAPHIQN